MSVTGLQMNEFPQRTAADVLRHRQQIGQKCTSIHNMLPAIALPKTRLTTANILLYMSATYKWIFFLKKKSEHITYVNLRQAGLHFTRDCDSVSGEKTGLEAEPCGENIVFLVHPQPAAPLWHYAKHWAPKSLAFKIYRRSQHGTVSVLWCTRVVHSPHHWHACGPQKPTNGTSHT